MTCRLKLNEPVSRILKPEESADPRPIGTKGFVSGIAESGWTILDTILGNLPEEHVSGKRCWPVQIQPGHPSDEIFSCACEWEPIAPSAPANVRELERAE